MEVAFKLSIIVFMAANLLAMGLEIVPREGLAALRHARFVALALLWSFVLCPALAWLATVVVPLEAHYASGLLLLGMAPCAPFAPAMVRRAGGDLAQMAALTLLTAVGTVAFMPLAVPWMVAGLETDAWTIARPLLFFVLVPLFAGMALKELAARLADRLLPAIRMIAHGATIVVLVCMAILFGEDFVGAIWSHAIVAQLVFLAVVTFGAYYLPSGLAQKERSVLAIGVGTRNLGAAVAPLMVIDDVDRRAVVMIGIAVPLTLLLSFLAATWFARQAARDSLGDASLE